MNINYENLETIAAYTENRPQEGFDMSQFCADDHGDDTKPSCGSHMCIIGDLPVIGGEFRVRPDEFECYTPYKVVYWNEYSERVTGLDHCSDEWNYLFGGEWVYVDNTPKGAAARIRYFIKNGLPEDPYGEQEGSEPLSYVENDDEG